MREWTYNSTILDLSSRVVSFTAWPLYSRGNSPGYRLGKNLGGPQSRSGLCGVEKNAPAGNRTPAVEPVARYYVD
jgi:hypothetical protein